MFTTTGIYSDGAPDWIFGADMKATGWRMVRNGHYRRFYDASGTLRAAYSYNACIYTTIETRDGVRGVINLTSYSVTTGRHQDGALHEACGVWGRWAFNSFHGQSLTVAARMIIDFHDCGSCMSHLSLATLAKIRTGDLQPAFTARFVEV